MSLIQYRPFQHVTRDIELFLCISEDNWGGIRLIIMQSPFLFGTSVVAQLSVLMYGNLRPPASRNPRRDFDVVFMLVLMFDGGECDWLASNKCVIL